MTSISSEVLIRNARPDETITLNELIMRSKSYWGYDQSFLEACRPLLILKPEDIEHNFVYCAEIDGTVVGISHFKMLNDTEIDFDHLFVEPTSIGQGIGRLLWQHAVNQARLMGAKALVFGADPHALLFYEHMGAIIVGENISTIIAGRKTPRMRYEIP